MAGKPHTTRLFCIHKLIASLHIYAKVCIVKQSTERIAYLRNVIIKTSGQKGLDVISLVQKRRFLFHFLR